MEYCSALSRLFFFAKDCLPNGQEQACSWITLLAGCLFVCQHAGIGLIHRKMVVECHLVITHPRWNFFSKLEKRNIWSRHSFAWLTLGLVFPNMNLAISPAWYFFQLSLVWALADIYLAIGARWGIVEKLGWSERVSLVLCLSSCTMCTGKLPPDSGNTTYFWLQFPTKRVSQMNQNSYLYTTFSNSFCNNSQKWFPLVIFPPL